MRRFAVRFRNLRAERQRRGWSQEALGQAAGIHRTEVSLLERASRDPRLGPNADVPPGGRIGFGMSADPTPVTQAASAMVSVENRIVSP